MPQWSEDVAELFVTGLGIDPASIVPPTASEMSGSYVWTPEGDLMVRPNDDDGFDEALNRAGRDAFEARLQESLELWQDRQFWANGIRETLARGLSVATGAR